MFKDNLEKKTFYIFIFAALLNGFMQSFFSTQDIIAKKGFNALSWQLTLLAMIQPISNTFSIWWGKLLEHSKNKAKYFLIIGIFGRLILLSSLFFTKMNFFLVMLAGIFLFEALLSPVQNTFYQANFNSENRAKIFGITISIMTGSAMLVSILSGYILDNFVKYLPWFLSLCGIFGFIASFSLSKLKLREVHYNPKPIVFKEMIFTPLKTTSKILKTNKAFYHYEFCFLLYGMGFIGMVPIVPIFLVDTLGLNYQTMFFAKGFIGNTGLLLFSPVLGKIMDKKNPFAFIRLVFGLLSLYPALLLITIFFDNPLIIKSLVYASYTVFGIAMAGIFSAWNLGSLAFAEKHTVGVYQSVHVTLTGIRGLMAPVLSLIVYKFAGMYAVFIMSSVFLLLSSLLANLYYKHENHNLKVDYLKLLSFRQFWKIPGRM